MKKNKIVVSVIVTTYNQEEYITQALDSITSQKTDFDFEVIVGNDCSPDNTAKLLDKYKYDNKHCFLTIHNRKKNLGSTRNEYELLMECRGDYIALLEGDDYWIDENKLQKQVDFLEANPKYIGVAHDCNDVDLEGNFIRKHSDSLLRYNRISTFKMIQDGYLDFHINTLLYRNIYRQYKIDPTLIYTLDRLVSDRTVPLLISDFGNIYIMKDVMSAYRTCPNRYHKTYLEHTLEMLEMISKLDSQQFTHHKIDNSYRKAKMIVSCWIYRMIKKEKNEKVSYSELNQYISFKVAIKIPVAMIGHVVRSIKLKIKRR